MAYDYNLGRFTRLMGLGGLPERVRRSIALAWCFGMGREHERASEHLVRALEALLEDWDAARQEATEGHAGDTQGVDSAHDGGDSSVGASSPDAVDDAIGLHPSSDDGGRE